MKFALQIYGEFRCFEKCLQDILYFINYYNKDFDVFILSQKESQTYNEENLNKIKKILGEKNIKVFKFIEDYSKEILEKENMLQKKYLDTYKKFKNHNKTNYTINGFVTRLYFRRWLNNKIRKKYEEENNITYDFIVRTRFDISFNHKSEKNIFDYTKTPFFSFDTMSIAKPTLINIESELGLVYPYIPNNFFDEKVNKIEVTDKEILKRWPNCNKDIFNNAWVFMPEINLKIYLFDKCKKEMLNHFSGCKGLIITR